MWHQLCSTSGVQTITSSHSVASGLSGLPVMSQRGPRQASAASSVSGVLALVTDDDEQLGVALGREHELERLHRLASGLRRVERGAAPGEEPAHPVGKRAAPSAPRAASPAGRRSRHA